MPPPRGDEEILEPLRRREVLYAPDADPANLAAHGRAYLEAGRICDALDFFERAADRPGLQEVLSRARMTADYFLFDRAVRALGIDVESAEWARLGDLAGDKGFEIAAYRFRLRAGMDVRPPIVEPITPLPRGAAPPPPDPSFGPSDDAADPAIDSSGRV